MSKMVSILGVCAIIAGASAYAMFGNYNDGGNRGCDGCRVGHVNATMEPACGHDHDGDSAADVSCCASKVSAAKASCCDSETA